MLNEHIILLTKKRSQLKAAVAKMVQQCYAWVKDSKLPSKEIELKLIETLRTITKGKIYVEVERARLTYRLAQMQEGDGDIASAAKTMQDLQGMFLGDFSYTVIFIGKFIVNCFDLFTMLIFIIKFLFYS